MKAVQVLCQSQWSIPFLLVFVKGNISRCAGCGKKNLQDVRHLVGFSSHNRSGKVHPHPHDICLMHNEFVTFENPNTFRFRFLFLFRFPISLSAFLFLLLQLLCTVLSSLLKVTGNGRHESSPLM